jgi:6-phosphogluconolactonase
MSLESNLHSFPSAEALAEAVASRWLDAIAAASQQGVPHRVALSGGRIATKFFAAAVAQCRARGLSWDGVNFFWADERCLPPTDPESNFRTANELLFSPLDISARQIHRLKGEGDPATAAREASVELLRLAPANAEGQPVLDLVLLGLGEDGHVASLFPGAGAEVWDCQTPFLVIHDSPKPPPVRISLSYAAMVAAKRIWVLASGAGKEKALQDSLQPGLATSLGRVLKLRADTQIFTDLPANARR